ncbi:MAG TPA: cytochrome b/b6 domain-containing protein [Acidimicrobiales bacterium]|nr:cytochrome b/b6 domain-containing protein [Acidimicrobiales bacterium]
MSLAQASTKTLHVLRFDRVQRSAHWSNALLFLVLMFTAIPLYFGSFFGVVLPRHLIEMIHLWSGLALPLPIIISLIGPWGNAMRHDVRRINDWTRDEIRWMQTFGRTKLEADKFNPGQKLNAIFIGASILVTLVTGAMLQWFRFFPVSWRSGATFVHDVFAYAIFIVVIGHIFMALTRRDALRSMFKGWVSEGWAARHARRWLTEEQLGDGGH